MRKVYFGNLPANQFHLLQKFSDQVDHAIFTRDGGVSKGPYESLNVRFGVGDAEPNVRRNRTLILKALGVKPEMLISANQTHSKNVQIIDEEFLRYHPP
ncbi:MAG TPA: laccase domain-containing protein, partial [Candidatus Gracilibacteria bacterium]|nr:laccase domain-containing protein [Candidatus Gracilibacteria bacterium]